MSEISMTIAAVKFYEKERGSLYTSKHQVLGGLKTSSNSVLLMQMLQLSNV